MTSVRNFMAGLSDRAIDRICCGAMTAMVSLFFFMHWMFSQ